MWHFTGMSCKKKKKKIIYPVNKFKFIIIVIKKDIVISGKITKPQISLDPKCQISRFKRADLWYPTSFIRLITRSTRYISLCIYPDYRKSPNVFHQREKRNLVSDFETLYTASPQR